MWLLMARMAVGGRRLAQRGCLGAPSGRCQAQRRCFLFPVSPSVSERPRKPVLATGHQRLNEDSTTTDSGHLHEVNTPISLKFTYNRLNLVQPLSTAPVSPTLYTSSFALPPLPGTNGSLVFPGYSATTPGAAIPFGGPQNVYQVYDDLSWTKGRHQFKFGGAYVQARDNRVFGGYENAVESLTGSGSIADAAVGLAIGQLFQFQGAVYPQGKFPCSRDSSSNYIVNSACLLNLPVGQPDFGRNNRYNDGSFYLQDSWKATSRLSLNLGIRWEYYGVQHNSNPALDSNFFTSGRAVRCLTRSVRGRCRSPTRVRWADCGRPTRTTGVRA